MLQQEISRAVRNLLGWERKQYGDAMCFLTITFRDTDNEVIEERYVLQCKQRHLSDSTL